MQRWVTLAKSQYRFLLGLSGMDRNFHAPKPASANCESHAVSVSDQDETRQLAPVKRRKFPVPKHGYSRSAGVHIAPDVVIAAH